MDWREIVKYPKCEGYGSMRGVQLMDALNALIPIDEFAARDTDRVGKFIFWIAAGEKAGLITLGEASDIRKELIHGCGGL
jgi:hypothetical protein